MTDDVKHAVLSPSGAHRWLRCAGSVGLTKDLPRTSSKYADEGTAAHAVAASLLLDAEPIGCTDDTRYEIQKYVDTVRAYAEGGRLLVEQSVPIGHLTGEVDAKGTADAVILHDSEIVIIDLKFGKGVKVDAERNEQLMLYALGALEEYSVLGDFKTVRMVISQPRLDHTSEWSCTVEELAAFGGEVKLAAEDIWTVLGSGQEAALTPHDKACRFCGARATCPALLDQNFTTIVGDFVDLTQPNVVKDQLEYAMDRVKLSGDEMLDNLFPMLDMIDKWVTSVRAQVEARLFSGAAFKNVKLVEGRRGDRKWVDAEEVVKVLKVARMKADDIYETKVISPARAEKLLAKDHPRYWAKLQELMTQSEGKPSVAAITDKRPALSAPSAEDFAVLEAEDVV